MAKKKKPHYAHDGKLIPITEKQNVLEDIKQHSDRVLNEKASPDVDIEDLRIQLINLMQQELDLCLGNQEAFERRTRDLEYCSMWLVMLEDYWCHPDGTEKSVTGRDAKFICMQAVKLGAMMERCRLRVLEPFAVESMMQKAQASKLNASKQKFEISRSQLIKELKKVATQYWTRVPRPDQKELCEMVGNHYGVSGETIRKKMQAHNIRKTDYATTE
jgi:hypothetical protein